jgi:hypothetical protein
MSAPTDKAEAWNKAHDRLHHFLTTFALGDHSHVSRLTLEILDRTRKNPSLDPTRDPTRATMEEAQKLLAEWLGQSLREEDRSPASILANGYIALLLSRIYRTAPDTFLEFPLTDQLRESMRETLLVTGPDFNVSSMTPRHLDYGPMLGLARQTWHRWDAKTFLIALATWSAVYVMVYLWLSGGF